MIYEEFAPSPELAGAVSYWRFALPTTHQPPLVEHTVPPDGVVSLTWLPTGHAVIVGPRLTALRVPARAGTEYIGVRFFPGAAGPLLGCNVPALRNQLRPLDNPELAVAMSTRSIAAIDQLMLTWARRAGWNGPDPVVAELTRRIVESDGAAPVSELTAGLDLSYRQILRRFHEAAGLTPKEFARIRRLRAACLAALRTDDPHWADVSAGAGFSDQSHLAREFQDIYAWPPRLVHEYLRRIEHSSVIP